MTKGPVAVKGGFCKRMTSGSVCFPHAEMTDGSHLGSGQVHDKIVYVHKFHAKIDQGHFLVMEQKLIHTLVSQANMWMKYFRLRHKNTQAGAESRLGLCLVF